VLALLWPQVKAYFEPQWVSSLPGFIEIWDASGRYWDLKAGGDSSERGNGDGSIAAAWETAILQHTGCQHGRDIRAKLGGWYPDDY
jgi:hypothetical protein